VSGNRSNASICFYFAKKGSNQHIRPDSANSLLVCGTLFYFI